MRLPKIKIEKFCGKDDPRPYINHVILDPVTSRLIATDGRRLMIQLVELSDDEHAACGNKPIYIMPEVFTQARKAVRKYQNAELIISTSEFILADGSILPRAEYEMSADKSILCDDFVNTIDTGVCANATEQSHENCFLQIYLPTILAISEAIKPEIKLGECYLSFYKNNENSLLTISISDKNMDKTEIIGLNNAIGKNDLSDAAAMQVREYNKQIGNYKKELADKKSTKGTIY